MTLRFGSDLGLFDASEPARGETLIAASSHIVINYPMYRRFLPLLGCLSFLLAGCIHVKMDPIQVHAVVDVNVKVDQAVNSLLADIYGDSTTVKAPSSPSTP